MPARDDIDYTDPVKRYNPKDFLTSSPYESAWTWMREDPQGSFVLYHDYLELQRTVKQLPTDEETDEVNKWLNENAPPEVLLALYRWRGNTQRALDTLERLQDLVYEHDFSKSWYGNKEA